MVAPMSSRITYRQVAKTLSFANARRMWKVLRAVRFFRGHRYVFARAARSYFDIALRGKRPLRAAELSIGNACQLRCAHCYATEVTATRAPLDGLLRAIDALDELGCLAILLVGGEPTLRPDLAAIVAHARRRRIVPFIFTNGLVDRVRLVELRDAGLFGLLVSLLGVGERHDRFVGRAGAYDQALATLADARDLGLFTSINTTVTRDSLSSGDFARLIAIARELGVNLKLNYPALLGRWSGRFDQLLGAAELAIVEAALSEPHVTTDMVSGYFPDVCPAGHSAIYVTDTGEVTPCAYIPISFGNVAEEPIAAIHARMVSSPVFGAMHGRCLVGEDREFIERYIVPTGAARALPMRASDHPRRDELVALATTREG